MTERNEVAIGGRRCWQTILVIAALTCGLVLGSTKARSASGSDADFAASKVFEAPTEMTAGVPVTLGFRLRNDGADTKYAARATFAIPTSLLLAAPPPTCFARYDAEQRHFIFEGQIPHGWEAVCRVALVAQPDASNVASFSLDLFVPPDRYISHTARATIIDPPTPAVLTLGPFGATSTGVAVLGWLAFWLVLFGFARVGTQAGGDKFFSRRAQAVTAANAIGVSVGFLLVFADLAWKDWRALDVYQESRCEIYDLAFKHEAVAAASDPSGSGIMRGLSHTPVLSLGYTFKGERRQTLGFSTDSRLGFSAAEIQGVIDGYRQREPVRCWVDPDDPRRVVVLKGFGGAYFFAILPTALLLFGLWLWRRVANPPVKRGSGR